MVNWCEINLFNTGYFQILQFLCVNIFHHFGAISVDRFIKSFCWIFSLSKIIMEVVSYVCNHNFVHIISPLLWHLLFQLFQVMQICLMNMQQMYDAGMNRGIASCLLCCILWF